MVNHLWSRGMFNTTEIGSPRRLWNSFSHDDFLTCISHMSEAWSKGDQPISMEEVSMLLQWRRQMSHNGSPISYQLIEFGGSIIETLLFSCVSGSRPMMISGFVRCSKASSMLLADFEQLSCFWWFVPSAKGKPVDILAFHRV